MSYQYTNQKRIPLWLRLNIAALIFSLAHQFIDYHIGLGSLVFIILAIGVSSIIALNNI